MECKKKDKCATFDYSEFFKYCFLLREDKETECHTSRRYDRTMYAYQRHCSNRGIQMKKCTYLWQGRCTEEHKKMGPATVKSLDACSLACEENGNCNRFNYRETTKECILINGYCSTTNMEA